jgi:hypothetical protein
VHLAVLVTASICILIPPRGSARPTSILRILWKVEQRLQVEVGTAWLSNSQHNIRSNCCNVTRQHRHFETYLFTARTEGMTYFDNAVCWLGHTASVIRLVREMHGSGEQGGSFTPALRWCARNRTATWRKACSPSNGVRSFLARSQCKVTLQTLTRYIRHSASVPSCTNQRARACIYMVFGKDEFHWHSQTH